MRISILLVEDHLIVREGLRKILGLESDFEVVGEAADGRQALALAQTLCPSVVVMDIAMPILNGMDATRHLLKLLPGVRVLILSAHGDDAYITRAAECGVAGFVLKQNSVSELCVAIRSVVKGEAFFSPTILNRLRCLRVSRGSAGAHLRNARVAELSPREGEVLQLVAEGNANKQTAAVLGISIKTVEKHRGHLMEKLGIHDTAGLTRYAIGAGIVSVDVR